jgi:hypothetical protein
MASNFVSYRDNNVGFWISDSLLEVVCSYIIKVIESEKNNPEWLSEMSVLLKKNSEGHYPSHMHLRLSDYLVDDIRKNKFLGILDSVENLLKEKGDYIKVDELNGFIVNEDLQSKWNAPLETFLLLRTVTFLKDLVGETMTTKIGDPIDYWK